MNKSHLCGPVLSYLFVLRQVVIFYLKNYAAIIKVSEYVYIQCTVIMTCSLKTDTYVRNTKPIKNVLLG